MTTPSDDRTAAAKAYQWASRIMVVALEMVLPGLAGHWLDVKLGTVIVFLLIGMTVGSIAAIMHLIQMTKTDSGRNSGD